MTRAPFLSVLLILLSLGASALAEPVPHFTDQDLERYRKPSDSRRSTDSFPYPESAGQKPVSGRSQAPVLRKTELPYTAFEGNAHRVIIPVLLNGSVPARMALDTGSPGMILFERLASRMGIFDNDDGRLLTRSAGIGGAAPSVLTVVESIKAGAAEDRFIPAHIIGSLSDAFDGLIGMDFMSRYGVRIDTARHVVVFEERPDQGSLPGGHDERWWRSTFRDFAARRAEWKQFGEALGREQLPPDRLEPLKRFAEKQYREADRLFTRLNSHAADHAVPMHWRQY